MEEQFAATISYSEIDKWRRCHQMHNYLYVERIQPKHKDARLELGNIIHDLLAETAYNRPMEPKIKELKKKYASRIMMDDEFEHVVSKGIKIARRYVKHWDKKDPLSYKYAEHKFGPYPLVKLPNGAWIGLVLIVDGIAIDKYGDWWLVERKTMRKFGDTGVRLWDLQTSLYLHVLREMGIRVEGVLWDEIRTKLPVKPEILKSGALSKRKNIDSDYRTYLKAIVSNGLDPGSYEDMLEPLKKRTDHFFRRQRHPMKDVITKNLLLDAKATALEIYAAKGSRAALVKETGFGCRFCDFSNLCRAELLGLDVKFMRKAEFTNKERR